MPNTEYNAEGHPSCRRRGPTPADAEGFLLSTRRGRAHELMLQQCYNSCFNTQPWEVFKRFNTSLDLVFKRFNTSAKALLQHPLALL